MAEKVQEQKRTEPAAPASAIGTRSEDGLSLREKAALAILSAYVTRQGGFNANDMDIIMRTVWKYADRFVAMKDMPPLPEPKEFQATLPEPPPRQQRVPRAARPDDEWGVRMPDGTQKRGFVTEIEAEEFCDAHPGAEPFQITGHRQLATM